MGWLRNGCIRHGWLSSKGRDTTEGEVEASHCNQLGLSDAAFLKLL